MKQIAIKQRFYPTIEQAELLAKTFGCCRVVYNKILQWRTDAFYNSGESINYNKASAKLTELKKDPDLHWLNEVSSVPLQQAIRHQQTAFKNFFEKSANYPKFKKKNARQSITLASSAFTYKDGKIFIAKSKEALDIRWSRKLPSEPSTITIAKDTAGRYFVSMLCTFESKSLPITAKMIGIDLGLTDLMVTSEGEKFRNPKYTKRYEKKLAYLQRQLAKKKQGSKNRDKARKKVARLHAKIVDCRIDNLQKISQRLVIENQVIAVESLAIKNMIKHPTLSKHIADASWGSFLKMLKYKAEWYGRKIVEIDRFYPSSKRCHCCGYINASLTLKDRQFVCPSCSNLIERDIGAAKNILAVGMAVSA